MNSLAKAIMFALILSVIPTWIWAQDDISNHAQAIESSNANMTQKVQIRDYENGFLFNVFEIANVEERVQLASALATSDIWLCNPTENPGELFIRPNSYHADNPIYAEFDYLRMILKEEYEEVSLLPKEEFTEIFNSWAHNISNEYYNFLISDHLDRANHCMDAEPFCTTDVYNFPANNSGYSWAGPNYGCLGSSPTSKHSFWYYMRIGVAGNITIKIEASFDVDFALWGPFANETDPCPTAAGQTGMLTANCTSCPNNTLNPNFYPSGNLHDCSYSANSYEYAHVVNGQVGQYFILLITNYSGSSGNITFQKYAGNGETDCGILPGYAQNDGPYCVGQTIHLTVNAQEGATYSWSGPGGFTSNQQNPSRPNCTMNMAGTYTCVTTVGSQSVTATTDVVIHPQPTANFTFTTVCKGNPTQFTSTSTTNPSGQTITSYLWNFGDGQTSTQQNPSHQYANAGTYNVSLTVACGNGLCTHTRNQNVTVYEAPIANAGPDDFCDYGSTYQLHGSGGAGTYNFHWEPANMVVSPNAQNTQTVVLYNDQTFTLTVSNPQGQCTDNDQVTIHISGSAMAVSAGPDIEICQGGSGEIYVAAGGGTGNYIYSWTPTTGLNNPSIANPIASPSQTTTYTCSVSDGATTQNASVTVTVNDVIVEDDYVSICPDDYYLWHGTPYSIPGTYQIDTVTEQGCDKTLILHLDHYPTYDETTINTAICEGETYYFYGTPYNYSCQVSHTDQTIHGCDSIVRLNLTVWPENPLTTNEVTVCPEQLPYTFYGENYYGATDVTVWDTDIHGCDSAVRLVLTVSDYYMPEVVHKYICYEDTPSYTWNPYGNYTFTLTEEGFYTDTLSTSSCDGIFRLDLHFKQIPEVKQYTVEACDSYYWSISGETYTESGDYSHSFPIYDDPSNPSTLYNCTEDYLLHLTINPSHTNATKLYDHKCDSIPFDWFGQIHYLKANGTYPFSGETTLGCDSAMLVTVENMRYTPNPCKIQCTDGSAVVFGDTIAVVTNTEFFSFNYDFSVQETGLSVWDECVWSISKPSWHIEPYPAVVGETLNRCCKVYVADRDENLVVLTATARNSCGEATRTFYLKSSFLDINEQGHAKPEVTIVPNPNDGQMRLNFENMQGRVGIKVYDMTGNQIDAFETFISSNSYNCDYTMKRYAEGIYIFVISDNICTLTRKVVIIH